MTYTPRFGTDSHKLISHLAKHAPHGGKKWLLTKSLAEEAGIEKQGAVHSLLALAVNARVVVRDMVDEHLRWQAGPEAVDALERSVPTRLPNGFGGFPSAEERKAVEFTPREGGSMDKAHKHLQSMPAGDSIAEADLVKLLDLPADSDLRLLFKPAIEAGAFDYLMVPNGTEIERRWMLGDGRPPHAETSPPTRGRPRKPPKPIQAPAPIAPPSEIRSPTQVAAAPTAEPWAIPPPPWALPPLPVPAHMPDLPFRCGIFSNGVLTIQKDHGVVELTQEETLELFEHISPYALRARK